MTPDRAEHAMNAAFGPGAWAEAGEHMTPEDDAELNAIRTVAEALAPLPIDVRARILRWAVAKYAVEISRTWGHR